MSLIELQRDFRDWLQVGTDGTAARFGARAWPGLLVYQNNYRAQLVACLEQGFAVTRDWIGADAFLAAAATHIDRVPPSSWTLDAYPRDFPASLGRLYPEDPEVAEIAWLELALAEAFVAADSARVDPAMLAGVDWDRAILHVVPSLEIGDVLTNAPAIWSAIGAGMDPPGMVTLPERGAVLVWRPGQVPHFRTAEMREVQALLLARSGATFAALCTALVAAMGDGDGVAYAGQLLGQWVADGLIAAISST